MQIDAQLFVGLVLVALASAAIGGMLVALFTVNAKPTPEQVREIKRQALAEFSRRGAQASNSKRREAERKLVLETAEQMRRDLAAKGASSNG